MIRPCNHDIRNRIQGTPSDVRRSTSKGFGEWRKNKTTESLAEQISVVSVSYTLIEILLDTYKVVKHSIPTVSDTPSSTEA